MLPFQALCLSAGTECSNGNLTWRHVWWGRGKLPEAGWWSETRERRCLAPPSKTAPGSGSEAASRFAWWGAHQLERTRSTERIGQVEETSKSSSIDKSSKDNSEVDNRKPLPQAVNSAVHLVKQGDFSDWEVYREGRKVPRQDKSSLTLIHVPGEASQDTTQRCCIKKTHWAEQETAKQLVMERRGSLHCALSTQGTAAFLHELWHA